MRVVHSRFGQPTSGVVFPQAPPVVPAQNMDPEEATRLTPDWEREYDYGLQIIQTLLYSLEFGENNWAYLIKRRNGSWDFVHKKEQLYIISEAPWCPLVDEREIQITSWLFAEDRQGIWNGKDVDVFIAWDNAFAKQLEKTMIGYKLLIARGLENFTYPLIGHVVRSGSREICGMITEPALGRTVQNMDKSLVYSAVAQIERAGLLFTGLKPSNIMIYNGKVRFVSICSMHKQPSDKIEREKELTYWHWEQLDSIFKEMSMFGNPIPAMRCLKSSVTEIPPLPSPTNRPLRP
ncbi:hypothetical protein C8J57DRAFT_1508032 [Mycena rebaudengoi]|nr:hypothetical protein C8J57DRAFT_1508032 [Mycena rebaudengoi]